MLFILYVRLNIFDELHLYVRELMYNPVFSAWCVR